MESVILSTPILWAGYLIAFVLCILGFFKRVTFILPLISAAAVVGITAYALMLGASLYEAAIIFLIFLFLNLIAFFIGTNSPNDKDDKNGENKK